MHRIAIFHLRPFFISRQVKIALCPDLRPRRLIAALPAAGRSIEVAQRRDLRLGFAGEQKRRQVGLDDGVPLPAALTEPERAARVRGDDLVLDQYLVFRQVRDRAPILVLGRLLERYPCCCALLFASACSCSCTMATGIR